MSRGLLALCLLALATGCRSGDTIQRLTLQLNAPETRELACARLVQWVGAAPAGQRAERRREATRALISAYADDLGRGAVVAALIELGDPSGEAVLIAAVRDFDRGARYTKTAARAARALATRRTRGATPALLQLLERTRQRQAGDTLWIRREVVATLAAISDPAATDALVKLVETDPSTQDPQLNRLAIRALGRLRTPAAADALARALAGPPLGELLFEETRRALCETGPPARAALQELVRGATTNAGLARGRARALIVLADLGDRQTVEQQSGQAATSKAPALQVAHARALLRAGLATGESLARQLLRSQRAPLTVRRQAATLLGWYGRAPATSDRLRALLERQPQRLPPPLLSSVAEALSRIGPRSDVGLLRAVAEQSGEPASRAPILDDVRRFAALRPCANTTASPVLCLRRRLQADHWATRERAALELMRRGALPDLDRAFTLLAEDRPSVRRALLLLLGQADLSAAARQRMARRLRELAGRRDAAFDLADDLRADAQCLAARLEAATGGR